MNKHEWEHSVLQVTYYIKLIMIKFVVRIALSLLAMVTRQRIVCELVGNWRCPRHRQCTPTEGRDMGVGLGQGCTHGACIDLGHVTAWAGLRWQLARD